MITTDKGIETLNDLIEINNDRVAGFEKASKDLEANDSDLRVIFTQFSEDSKRNAYELTNAVKQYGGDPETGTSASGNIHRAWIDVKATFSGHDRKSILEECERGEDAIKKAYQEALQSDSGLNAQDVQLLRQQKSVIDAGHDSIKALRDSQ